MKNVNNKNIKLLDCTLRDGAYIVDGLFGENVIYGVIDMLEAANVDIIECGWFRNNEWRCGSSEFHKVQDVQKYLKEKKKDVLYCVMIDYNRYDLQLITPNDGKSVDMIRIAFPYGKSDVAMEMGKIIQDKGYKVSFQMSNIVAYTEKELFDFANEINKNLPYSVCIADTFGAMYPRDVENIVKVLDGALDEKINFGIHTHNNQELAFANIIKFLEMMDNRDRDIIVDASIYGLGRGAGNAPIELMANYLNKYYDKNYDEIKILEAIDLYIDKIKQKEFWGYDKFYAVGGMQASHINNIKYLIQKYNMNIKDMWKIFDKMSEIDKAKYDYDKIDELIN